MSLAPVPLVEIHRGPILESLHTGHAVICDGTGQIVESWGDPRAVVLPRSSSKMLQALPLVASGAARAFGLSTERLALSCASHEGAPLHVAAVNAWLADLGLGDDDLICGPQVTRDKALKLDMIRHDQSPCRVHNNCSGKHTGFLTLNKHLGADANYVDPSHPVQTACKELFEAVTDETSPGFGIDGCSAPNFATTMHGMARAMAFFATAHGREDAVSKGAAELVQAMMKHPDLVAGDGRSCTLLMQAAKEPFAVKMGAEGFFVGILPKRGFGIALKITDGGLRAADSAMAALLVRIGALDAANPVVQQFLNPPVRNWDGLVTGEIRPVAGLTGPLA
ncbi:asparaginase [Tropicibacter naphthalenivorans]|uniref:L-asparaginase II n=1 Tax=Tropicibacter naphthalenivorans TaxID=441103 RepID=A0A0P1GVE4_9RHOB|nr:asparaginase [Tropicibacter naphthalenivorans]CUH79069.1 L-asparaginase II [Tropicibacter naphthalenivorans]SMD03655.1 asparaginase [Tropicibacter naphthalenivorans]